MSSLSSIFNKPPHSSPRRTKCELTLSLALLGVATLPAGGLLQVVGFGAATTAQGVRLVPALTERGCSLRLEDDN